MKDPIVRRLLEGGNSLRRATVKRDNAKAAENRAVVKRKALTGEWVEIATSTRKEVLRAADRGYSTLDIAEILGINEAWVTRVRAERESAYVALPPSGPKLTRRPDDQSHVSDKPRKTKGR